MSDWLTIRMVAGRELAVRLTSKTFLISTAGLVAAIVVGGVLLQVAGSSEPTKVGFTPQTEALSGPVEALTGKDGGDEVKTVTVRSERAGERQVRAGDLDVLVTGSPGDIELVVDTELDQQLESIFTAIAQQQRLNTEISDLGGDPEKVADQVAGARPTVTALDPDDVEPGRVLAGYVVGILIFLSLMTTGQMVAQGVVEEKTSRVVELLLAAVRPWQLMAGKVLGIGVVGLIQITAVVAAGVLTSIGLGLLDGSSLDLGATAGWTLVWFVIGFASFALVMAALAALVSRQEDVGSVTAPVMAALVVPYLVAISIGTWEPDNPLVVVMSYLPFSAPMVMPVRVAGGSVDTAEVLVSIAISLAVIPLLVRAAGRMYGNAVLQTGSRMKVLQALRG